MNNFKKIKFSQLLASVRDDLHKYADEGMIDPSRLIKVVHRCNDVLGVNIYDRKQCVVEVKNGRADLPLDFYKMEMVLGIGEVSHYSGLINPHVKKEYDSYEPACLCEGDKPTICVYPVHQPDVVIKYDTITPLILSGDTSMYAPNSPASNWVGGAYRVDLQEDFISVGFKSGRLFIGYLADLVDPDTGELLIPFAPQLIDYYENSLKTKILEDLLANSEADVERALQYYKRERNLSYYEATSFVSTKSYREWDIYRKKTEIEFYRKYYKMFN